MRVIARVLVLAALAACGDPAARIELAPVDLPGNCGKPARAHVTGLDSIAYHEGTAVLQTLDPDASASVPLAGLPSDTEQLGIEVVGANGVVAAGKTMPLSLDALANGAVVPIVVLPLQGFCETVGAPISARTAPAVAVVGNGVLIVGGRDATGAALATAEYYDAGTTTFADVPVPQGLLDANGFVDVSVGVLDDGTALVTTGEHVGLVFDPVHVAFAKSFAFEQRIGHATIAFDANDVLIAGGCEDVIGTTCGTPVQNVEDYPIAKLEQGDGEGAVVATQKLRVVTAGGPIFDLGEQVDGARGFFLGGGFASSSSGDVVEWSGTDTPIQDLHAQVLPLVGGQVLSAFDPDGSPQTGDTGVLAPGSTTLVAVATGPTNDMQRIVALEDGSVLEVGGDSLGAITQYIPMTNAWAPVITVLPGDPATGNAVTPPALDAPTLARLPDGSVLVLGGNPPSAQAWLYRPSLVGASTDVVGYNDAGHPGMLVPSNPAAVSSYSPLVLVGTDSQAGARALLGGTLTTNGTVTATVEVAPGGGVALIAQQRGPGRALIADFVPGMPPTITRQDGTTQTTTCTGSTAVPAFQNMIAVDLALAISGQTATAMLSGTPILTCSLAGDPDASDRGAWGIAAEGSGAQVTIETLGLQR